MSDRSASPDDRRASVARPSRPAHEILLPGVKLDLGVLVLALLCLWFGVMIAPLSRPMEVLVLLGGSLLGAGWLALRIRRALAAARARLTGEAARGPE